jgi:hypothetical protein
LFQLPSQKFQDGFGGLPGKSVIRGGMGFGSTCPSAFA